MDPNQINFDEMMNNPDILLKACNDVFGNDTVVTQQQYYQQPAQTTSSYQQQTSQLQQQLQRSQIVEVLVKEVNELKNQDKETRRGKSATSSDAIYTVSCYQDANQIRYHR